MNEISISKSGDFLFGYMYDSSKNKYINLGNNEILKLLTLLKDYKKKIRNIFYSGNNINFTLDDMNITISNIQKLKSDDNFSFIFDVIKDKKYKPVKTTLKIISIIGLASAVSITGMVSIQAINNTDFNKEEVSVVSYSDTKQMKPNLEEVLVNEDNKSVQSSNLKEIEQKETDIKTQNQKEETLIDTTIEKELKIGSDASSDKLKYVNDNYSDIIEKYASMYNLDANLIKAIATQERGEHSDVIDDGGAIGLMQIQVLVWNDKDINVYNYETNSEEKIHITLDKLKDVDFNIKVGCAIFQNYLNQMNGNVIAAIQSYNMGPGSVKKIISTYASATGKTYDEVLNNFEDINWLDYRNSSYPGDPDYAEHVSRYYKSDDATKVNVR